MENITTASSCGIFEPPARPKITKEMKAAMESSGLSKAEQKAALNEQLAVAKEKYLAAKAVWKAKPQTPQEEVDALKAVWEEKKNNLKARKAEAKKECKNAISEAKKLEDVAARELAISLAKNKCYNALLDLDEDLRVARAALNKATMSSDEIYKYHKGIKLRAAIWRDRNLYLMLVPFMISYIVFSYMPMYGLLIAFKDYNPIKGILESPWAPMGGFYHFYSFMSGPYFGRLLRNTFLINFWSIIFSFPLPIIFAILLNEARNKMFKTTIQTISYLPHFVSMVVIAGLVINFLSPSTGLINFLYKWLTGSPEGIYFLAKPEYFRTIYVTMNAWAGTGFASIIYTSALAGIDQELYEAARIDGAGRWRQLFSITIPGIMPTIAINLIMRLGSVLQLGYETIILLYQPITYQTADVISTYVYRAGLREGNYSLGTAVGLFNAAVALIMVNLSNAVSRKIGDVGLW